MWNSTKAFYDSKEWKVFRENLIIDRTNSYGLSCSKCNKNILKEKIILHHKQELTKENVNDYNISLNPDNIEMLCLDCHNKEHSRFGYKKSKGVYIVYGPPFSGKTSYVLDNKTDLDLVIDLDRIYEAITMLERYNKPSALRFNVFDIRDTLIDNILTKRGNFESAWIIGGYPNKVERERLAKKLGAELIYIDTTKEECLSRLKLCNDYRKVKEKEWSKYIEEWFDMYLP